MTYNHRRKTERRKIVEKSNFRKDRLPSGSGTIFLRVLLLLLFACAVAIVTRTSIKYYAEGQDSSVTETSPQIISGSTSRQTQASPPCEPPEINVQYLPINPYSRSGEKRTETKYIVIHYIGWESSPSTAQQNWQYFANLAVTQKTSVSSNFIIGMDGEIIQCMPIDEVAYANRPLNESSISIECCHPEKNGKFTDETYASLVRLVSWLCGEYSLGKDAVIRHYDVSGKLCPLYWAGGEGTEEYARWAEFKSDLDF